jgi:hypothetical protein
MPLKSVDKIPIPGLEPKIGTHEYETGVLPIRLRRLVM